MDLLPSLVNFILSTNDNQFQAKKCDWIKLWLSCVKFARFYTLWHIQRWHVLRSWNSGLIITIFIYYQNQQPFQLDNIFIKKNYGIGWVFKTISTWLESSSIERCIFRLACSGCNIVHNNSMLHLWCLYTKFKYNLNWIIVWVWLDVFAS